ncbi:hypothetical protein BGZ58_010209, partial [Dissophora ornata]
SDHSTCNQSTWMVPSRGHKARTRSMSRTRSCPNVLSRRRAMKSAVVLPQPRAPARMGPGIPARSAEHWSSTRPLSRPRTSTWMRPKIQA